MFKKKNINKVFLIFLLLHLTIWTLLPSVVNTNLPLDTIEALAWGRSLDWGFDKHPPLSAFVVETVYQFFGNRDWAYYLISQIFVIISFIYVYKFSKEFLQKENLALISVLLLEGIFFYNFTTPEFNVNVCQLPFWSLSIYYTWKCIQDDKAKDYFLLGIFIGLGILSKYLFIYLLISIKILFIYLLKNGKKIKTKNFLITGPITFVVLLPHLFWLAENNYVTFIYAFERTGGVGIFKDHIIFPSIFLAKQILLLVPLFLMSFFLIKNFRFNISFKKEKTIFLLFVVIFPIILVFLTSLILGAKIRTMWMTPFYLFIGVFLFKLLKKNYYKKI